MIGMVPASDARVLAVEPIGRRAGVYVRLHLRGVSSLSVPAQDVQVQIPSIARRSATGTPSVRRVR
jgi:hypothetical protein